MATPNAPPGHNIGSVAVSFDFVVQDGGELSKIMEQHPSFQDEPCPYSSVLDPSSTSVSYRGVLGGHRQQDRRHRLHPLPERSCLLVQQHFLMQ